MDIVFLAGNPILKLKNNLTKSFFYHDQQTDNQLNHGLSL